MKKIIYKPCGIDGQLLALFETQIAIFNGVKVANGNKVLQDVMIVLTD